jgi:AcrR family transcriptional regulator
MRSSKVVAVEASTRPRSRRRTDKKLLSLDAVLDAALGVLREDGLDAVTMRRVAAALDTGPASLYVYVPQRDDLLDAMLDRVMGEVPLEAPDPTRWRAQIHALMDETVAALLRYPGIARVGLGNIPTGGSALAIREAMLGMLLAGDLDVRGASWAIDVLPLLALATALETGRYAERRADVAAEGRRVARAYAELSPDAFPVTVAHLATVAGGTRTERFRFAVDTFLDGLVARGPRR